MKCNAVFLVLSLTVFHSNSTLLRQRKAWNSSSQQFVLKGRHNSSSSTDDVHEARTLLNLTESSSPSVTFLFMAYDRLPHLAIWEKFFHGAQPGKDFRVLVHCKSASKCRHDLRNHPIFNLIETVETEYCFGLVAAMNHLLQEALAIRPGHRNDKFVFVSDTTLPVKPFHLIQRQLTSDDASHFCFFPVHWLEWPKTSGFLSFLKKMNPWYNPSHSKERMALKHHQWMVLSRQHAEKAVKEDGMFPSLLEELRVNSGLPGTISGCDDEFWHFNALYAGINVTGSLETATVHLNGIAGEDIHYSAHQLQGQCDTFVYWQSANDGETGTAKKLGTLLEADAFTHLSHKAGHPCEITSLGSRSLRALRDSPFLFARKVMPDCSVHGRFRDLTDAFDALVFPDAIPLEDDDPPVEVVAASEKWMSFLRFLW